MPSFSRNPLACFPKGRGEGKTLTRPAYAWPASPKGRGEGETPRNIGPAGLYRNSRGGSAEDRSRMERAWMLRCD